MRVGFLASHRGSSARAIWVAAQAGEIAVEPSVLICNNSGAEALSWARSVRLEAHHLSGRTHAEADALDAAIAQALDHADVDLVMLSGYMKKLGPRTLRRFQSRILNIHPALLPDFGGPGMYGIRVHQAVIEAGATTTGISVHLVDADYDTGPVLYQARIPVRRDDTPQELQRRVSSHEPDAYLRTLRLILDGEIDLDRADEDQCPPVVENIAQDGKVEHLTDRRSLGPSAVIRAVVLDLDGTLLRSDGTVSAASRHALQQLSATDVRVVAATARAPRGVRSIVPEIPWAVCCNGAVIYDNTHHQITWERPFETAAVIEIVERALKAVPGLGFAARCGDDLVCNQHYADERSTPLPPGAHLVEQASDLDGHTVHGLAFRRAGLDAADLHAAADDALAGRGCPSTSNTSILDVAPPGVTKTLALEALAGQQRWSAEHAVAFGDMPNDLDVLAWAGLAVAVANAHPDVLEAADLVTDANDNDGVANALRQLGLVTPER